MTIGTTTWGRDTGTTTDNTRDFTGNWTGTGSITGSGDAEKIYLESGEYMESEVVQTAARKIVLRQNQFGAGDDVTIYYRTGATQVACEAADWALYINPFVSGGYAQIRLEGDPFPLRVNSGGRYLETANGAPFLLVGDSPQGLIPCLTPAQMETYFVNRASYGVNCIQVHLLAGATFGGNSTTFAAQDGTTAFTTNLDISTPREAFFAQVDAMLNLAKKYGIVVMLTAAESIDAGALWKANGTTKCTNFGAYLGNRYKGFSNIIWNYGNDLTPGDDTDVDDCIHAVCDGVKSEDSNHIHTAWLMPVTGFESSRDDSAWNGAVDLDLVYLYTCIYSKCLEDRALTPAMPLFQGESCYETENLAAYGFLTTAYHTRKINYWAVLSGACGTTYCNGARTWKFDGSWQNELDTYTGIAHLGYLKDLLTAYNWHLLIPDNAHTVLTAGYGTYTDGGAINTNDYATCAYLADDSLAIIYMPTNRAMTVDMSQFSGSVTCRWYDPTSGQFETDAASPHANSGSHDFSHAGANDASDADWVLVLSV